MILAPKKVIITRCLLRDEIDALNDRIYNTINNGVYKSGFSTTQEAYEDAIYPLFESLDWLEEKLSKSRFLIGNKPTEADSGYFQHCIALIVSMLVISNAPSNVS